MTSPFIPNSFTYGDAPQGGAVMPMVVAGRNPSNTIDKQYDAGYLWLSAINLGGSGLLYYQAGNSSGIPNWTVSSSAAGALNTLSDGATTVFPSGGNIALTGTANQITVTSSGPSHELVFSVPGTFIVPGSIESTTTITAGSGLTVSDGGAAITGNSQITGNLDVTGALTAGSFSLTGLTVQGTVAINTVGAGTTTIGNAAAGAITIDVGTGDFTMNGGGNEIHIGDDPAANDIFIGNDTGATAIHIAAGTGDVLIDGAVTAAITLGNATQTGLISIGVSTAGENVSINDAVPAASRTTTIAGGTIVGAGVTDTIDIAPDGATTSATAIKTVNINTGTVVLGEIHTNIASGTVTSGTHTTNIATGNRAAGTMTVNLLTGTGTKTLTVGDVGGGTTSTFRGPVNVNASINNNTAINSGTSTGTVTIGNTLAGAVTIGSSAASNFTVTGATVDLTLASSGGSVNITASEAAADAIIIEASDAAGGVQIKAGTGGILVGTDADTTPISVGDIAPTASRTITVGGGTVVTAAVTDTIDIGPDGATTNANSVKTVNINTGDVTTGQVLTNIASGTVTSGTHTTNIATGARAAGTMALNLMTGTGTKTLNIGNADGLTTVNIAGTVLKSTNPAFLAYLAVTAANKTGNGTSYTLGTDALTEVFDRGSNFNVNGTFTAPVTGIYDLRAQVTITGATIATTFVISIVTTTRTYTHTFIKAAGAEDESVFISSLCDMTATNTATVTITVSGEAADTDDILGAASAQTYFCGCLVA